jgi:ubiquinone/menaquinone biosynthesis C-methylase UbiE
LLARLKEFQQLGSAVALDGSAAMLERARRRFERDSSISFIQADFNSPEWTGKLPQRPFDVIVSGFAIHHSEDEQKRSIYASVFDLLAPGGVFVNIEHVASATSLGEEVWDEAWVEHYINWRRAKREQVDFATALREHRTSDERAANRLAPVRQQLDWLRAIGFVDVDCYFKYLELAVLAGYRSASEPTGRQA